MAAQGTNLRLLQPQKPRTLALEDGSVNSEPVQPTEEVTQPLTPLELPKAGNEVKSMLVELRNCAGKGQQTADKPAEESVASEKQVWIRTAAKGARAFLSTRMGNRWQQEETEESEIYKKPAAKKGSTKRPAAARGFASCKKHASAVFRKPAAAAAAVCRKPAAAQSSADSQQYQHENFVAKYWGHCRVEYFTKKSYIRWKDATTGKYRMVIGCSKNGRHKPIVRALLPHVRKGTLRDALFEIRQRLLDQ